MYALLIYETDEWENAVSWNFPWKASSVDKSIWSLWFAKFFDCEYLDYGLKTQWVHL